MPAETLIGWMDQTGVRRMLLMPRHYADDGRASDEQAADYARRYPGRFVAAVGGQRPDLWRPAAWAGDHAFLGAAERKLQAGPYRALGEFILHHYGYNRFVPTTDQRVSGDAENPADSPLMLAIAALGARFAVPVVIHAEAEPATREQVRRLLRASPRTTVVWAHNCGRAPAAVVADFLGSHPNLRCDLGQMAVPFPRPYGWGRGGEASRSAHVTVVQLPDGRLNAGMRDLFERFPDRFTIGTDTAHPFQYPRYGDMILAWRRLLSQLTPATARKIGFDNAERLFGTPAR